MTAAQRGGQRVGYVRVSSVGQNDARQLDGVELDEVFTDRASGKDLKRPALEEAQRHLRKGDVLVVHSMDRLARNMHDLQTLVKHLTACGVTIEFMSECLTFNGSEDKYGELMLHILGGVAQFERAMIKERQAEGIAKANRRGCIKAGLQS